VNFSTFNQFCDLNYFELIFFSLVSDSTAASSPWQVNDMFRINSAHVLPNATPASLLLTPPSGKKGAAPALSLSPLHGWMHLQPFVIGHAGTIASQGVYVQRVKSSKSDNAIALSASIQVDGATSESLVAQVQFNAGANRNVLSAQLALHYRGQTHNATVVRVDQHDDIQLHVFVRGMRHSYRLPVRSFGDTSGGVGKGAVSPMPGKITKVHVSAGTRVKAGAPLMVMEAMKMEHVIRAAIDGEVEKVLFKEGDFVTGGKTLVAFKA
jgi:biotin carboxyl carrier protein